MPGGTGLRWIALVRTSPSGKTLFVCKYCGVVSPAPSTCRESPTTPDWHAYHGLTCEEIEDRESMKIQDLHPILRMSIVRSTTLYSKVYKLGLHKGAEAIRQDRRAVLDLVEHGFNKAFSSFTVFWTDQLKERARLLSVIQLIREELKK